MERLFVKKRSTLRWTASGTARARAWAIFNRFGLSLIDLLVMAVSISSLVVVFAWLALSFRCLSLIFYQSYSLRLFLILARYNFLRASFFLFLSQFLFDWYNLRFWHLSNHCMSLLWVYLKSKKYFDFHHCFCNCQ